MEWSANRWIRAWLAFTVLQSLGSIFFVTRDASALSARLFCVESAASVRQYALGLGMLSIIRCFLLFHVKSLPLHKVNFTVSIVSILHSLLEMFYFGAMKLEYANFFNVGISALTVIFTVLYTWTLSIEEATPRSRRVGPRIFTKHFMESDILVTPPDTEEVRDLKKRL